MQPHSGRQCSRVKPLRGLLLTSDGFSEFGTKAGQAATVAWFAGGLLLVLALAGFAHAARTPRTEAFAPVEPMKTNRESSASNPPQQGPIPVVGQDSLAYHQILYSQRGTQCGAKFGRPAAMELVRSGQR